MKFTGTSLQDVESIVKWCTTMMGDQSARKAMCRGFFGRSQMRTTHTHIGSTQCKELEDFIPLEAQTTQPLKYGQEICHAFVGHVALLNGMSVNYQSGLIHGTESHLAPI
jgi:hypothetical protein